MYHYLEILLLTWIVRNSAAISAHDASTAGTSVVDSTKVAPLEPEKSEKVTYA